ncbi:MAG: GFA family protein, partial [Pseudomonadota bacterium]
MTGPPLPLSGQCRCGRVALRAAAAPHITSACHCRGCQRMTGGPYSLSALFAAEALDVTGETVIGGLHGADQRHHHCGHCLSWVLTRLPALPEIVNVRAPMFDDLAWFHPYLETSTDEALPFAETGAIRSYPSLPPTEDFPALMADYATWAAD